MTRAEAEDFLYREARLLDAWQLEAWAELFTDDGQYLIPPLEAPMGDPGKALFLVYDDRHRLGERAKRLLKKQAHAEHPHSVLCRMVGNVIVDGERDGVTRVTCNFVVYRSRNEESQVFPGRAIYDLVRVDGRTRIRCKRAIVDADSLREQGRISIIL
jgi:p-cumate 2,3-dioxygenase beta subunit